MQIILINWGDEFWASLAGTTMFLAEMPKIFGFVVILVASWFIAGLVEKGVAALLWTVNFKDLAIRFGFGDFVNNRRVKTDSAGIIALIVLVAVFSTVGFPTVSEVLDQLLWRLPNILAALVVLVLGGLAADAMSKLVRGATSKAELGNPDLLATIANVTVWMLAIVAAINQIGIATTLSGVFMALVGVVALALGLAFGISGRETAADIVKG